MFVFVSIKKEDPTMVERMIHEVTIECVRGDIASQADVEAVVNAANAELRTGGGVAGAIHREAGSGLAKECRQYAPIDPGEAVITGAHDLPNDYVIHCLGPVYGRDEPADELLQQCYSHALELAEENAVESIAFPALSTGAFGYPVKPAARIALSTVVDATPDLSSLKLIRFVLYGEQNRQVHEEVLDEVI